MLFNKNTFFYRPISINVKKERFVIGFIVESIYKEIIIMICIKTIQLLREPKILKKGIENLSINGAQRNLIE